jgi:dTDP-4-dehydrorhamnose reductase
MINILITGSNGQLGSCIKSLSSNYDGLNFIFTDYQDLDICKKEEVRAFFKSNEHINYCINCAAYTAVDKAEEDKENAFLINALGPKHLALACKENNTTLIQISTDFVFDGNKTAPYTETDVPNPISVYGDTKLKGEKEIEKMLQKYFIIRTSWLYSEHGNNFMKTMLKLAETRDEIGVVSDQIGSPTYAGDLTEVIIHIIRQKSKNYGTYHYSNEGIASWYDFAKAIFNFSSIKIKVNPIKTEAYPTPAKRPVFSVLDKSKIKNNLKVDILYWKESLKKAVLLF